MTGRLLLAGLLAILSTPTLASPARPQTKAPSKPGTSRVSIVVNKANNTLKLYRSGHPVRRYPVATGLYRCTPEGSFKVIQKSVLGSGGGDLGSHWIGLNTLGVRKLHRIGIHGTNDPKSIGKWASKACVRMHNRHVREVYSLVPMGTPVKILDIAEAKATPHPVLARAP